MLHQIWIPDSGYAPIECAYLAGVQYWCTVSLDLGANFSPSADLYAVLNDWHAVCYLTSAFSKQHAHMERN